MAPPTKKCKLNGVEQPPIWLLPALAVLVCLVECIPDERSKAHVRHVDGAVTREGGLDHREELVLVGNHEARDEVGQGRSENGVCTLEPAGARETQRLFAFRALKDSEHLRALGVAHRDAVLDDDTVQRQRLAFARSSIRRMVAGSVVDFVCNVPMSPPNGMMASEDGVGWKWSGAEGRTGVKRTLVPYDGHPPPTGC